MGSNRAPFSKHGMNNRVRVDIAALSPVARRQAARTMTVGAFTQASTVKSARGPLGFKGTLKAGYLSFGTVPAGGTLGVKVVAYSAAGNTEIVLTDVLNPEPLTAREAAAFVLAATNVALQAEDTIEIHTIADNTNVDTQQVDGYVTLVFERTEDTAISD